MTVSALHASGNAWGAYLARDPTTTPHAPPPPPACCCKLSSARAAFFVFPILPAPTEEVPKHSFPLLTDWLPFAASSPRPSRSLPFSCGTHLGGSKHSLMSLSEHACLDNWAHGPAEHTGLGWGLGGTAGAHTGQIECLPLLAPPSLAAKGFRKMVCRLSFCPIDSESS